MNLYLLIKQLVAEEKYVVGQHASERLEERGIMEWQVVARLEDGELNRRAARCHTEPRNRGSRIPAGRDRIQSSLVTSAAKRRCQARNSAFL